MAKKRGVWREAVCQLARAGRCQDWLVPGHRGRARRDQASEGGGQRLEEDMDILKPARDFSLGSSILATGNHGVCRRHESGRSCGRVDLPRAAFAGMPGRRTDCIAPGTKPPAVSRPARPPMPRSWMGAGHPRQLRKALRSPGGDRSDLRRRGTRGRPLHRGLVDAPARHEWGPPW